MRRAVWVLLSSLVVGCADGKSSDSGAAAGGESAGDEGTDAGAGGEGGDEGADGGDEGADGGDDGSDGGGEGTDGGDEGTDGGDEGTDGGDEGSEGGDEGSDGGDGLPLAGLGTLSGDCGDVLGTDELSGSTPSIFVNTLDLGTDGFDTAQLSVGGTEVWDDGNLGGSSAESEVIAFEVLYRCELASLLKTETEISYVDEGGKKTDLLVEIDGIDLGVSVTRAYGWPPEDPYTVEQATVLLEDKLGDIPLSSANVASEDAWTKQILSVIAYTPDHAASIATAWAALDAEVQGDTVLFVTATEGDDEALY
jgi:hypothetical protein